MLWPHPWHSLFDVAHILHKHASCNQEQCWWTKFYFSLIKNIIFHFLSVKNDFFAKHQPQICWKIWEIHFLKTLCHVICTNNQIVSIHLFWKTQVSADSGGNGSNLNYKCLVVCSWFLAKIIFRYTNTFINIQPLATNGHARGSLRTSYIVSQ